MRLKTGTAVHYTSVVAALFIWSTSFIATKIAYATFPPITLGAARFVIASLVLGLLLVIRREFVKLRKEDIVPIALSGLLGIPMYFSLQNIGVSLTTASNAALIVASYPAITVLLEALVYREKLTQFKIIGILLAICGIVLLTGTNPAEQGKNQLLGNLILILTGFVWAFYNFSTRKVVNKYPAITLSFYQTVIGTVVFLPLTLFEKNSWSVPTQSTLLSVVFLGIFCSVAAFLLYNYGLRKLSSGTAVSLMNLVPIFGVLFSVLTLHESVSPTQLLGGSVVIVGVLLSARQAAKNKRQDPKAVPLDEQTSI